MKIAIYREHCTMAGRLAALEEDIEQYEEEHGNITRKPRSL